MQTAARPPALGRRLAASIARHLSSARSTFSNVIPAKAGTHATSHALVAANRMRSIHGADAPPGASSAPEGATRKWASEAPHKKASATAPLIAFQSLRQPVWTPRDYAAFAREGFAGNPIVYRCVRMIAEAAASVPLLLYAGDDEIAEHPLLRLVSRPNPLQTGADLFETFYGHLLVSGNAYLEAAAINGDVRELHTLRPDRMKVIPGPDGWPEAYEYTVAGRTVRISGEPVPGVRPILHMRLFHAADDHYGMSPLEPAATAIDLHNTAAKWNKALLDNSARPSGALVYTARDGNLSAEQYERLKSELEEGFQGSANAGRPLLLEGGLDWKSMSLSPKDMDFIEARHVAAREIALALGVPPMLLGIPGDNTYSNLAEAQRIFWRQTVLPLVTRTAAALTNWLAAPDAQWASEGASKSAPLRLAPDLDAIEALSPERETLWARLEKTSFLTTNEKRTAAGYGPLPPATKFNPVQSDKANFNPAQLRDDQGQWARDGSDGASRDLVHPVNRRRGAPGSNHSPADLLRLDAATRQAERSARRTQELDPTWRAPQGAFARNDLEGNIRHQESIARSANERFTEITRDAIPGTNPSWGVNRLTREMYDRGFRLERPTDSLGVEYRNPATGEEFRVMQRPELRNRSDPPEKHYFGHYYRYRTGADQKPGAHVPIPDKK